MSYIEDARCLKVKLNNYLHILPRLTIGHAQRLQDDVKLCEACASIEMCEGRKKVKKAVERKKVERRTEK